MVYSLCPVAGVAQVLLSHLKENASYSYKSHDSKVTSKGKTVALPFSLLPSPPNHDREDSKQQSCKTNTTIMKRQSSVDEKARDERCLKGSETLFSHTIKAGFEVFHIFRFLILRNFLKHLRPELLLIKTVLYGHFFEN